MQFLCELCAGQIVFGLASTSYHWWFLVHISLFLNHKPDHRSACLILFTILLAKLNLIFLVMKCISPYFYYFSIYCFATNYFIWCNTTNCFLLLSLFCFHYFEHHKLFSLHFFLCIFVHNSKYFHFPLFSFFFFLSLFWMNNEINEYNWRYTF